MALDNYTNLIASIGNWLDRSDLEGAIADDLIRITEQEFEARLRIKELEKRFRFQITSQFSSVPTDFLEGREFKIIGNQLYPLQYRTPQLMDDVIQRGLSDDVKYFTIRGEEFQLAGAPPFTASETVSSATSVGTTVTITTASVHGLIAGDSITVTDSASEGYDVAQGEVATVPSTTTFTYTADAAPTATPATGTIAYVVNNAELTYYYKPTGLSSSNATNEIIDNYPSLYLWGCLKEAGAFIQDAEILNGYKQKYEDTLGAANKETLDSQFSGAQMETALTSGYYDRQ